MRVLVENPLPAALRHYEKELGETLRALGCDVSARSGAALQERSGKRLKVFWSYFDQRVLRPGDLASFDVVIVTWPAFGLLDLPSHARTNAPRTILLVHDVTPLQRSLGYGRVAKMLARRFRPKSVEVVVHSPGAARELEEILRIVPAIVDHPLLQTEAEHFDDEPRASGMRHVRVLGANKSERDLRALEQIGRALSGDTSVTLSIHGYGWSPVPGWHVQSEFLPERVFQDLLGSAACVVLPYRRFYQSGVAIQCVERGVPLVGPRHPQLEKLFGRAWPGFVDNGHWADAVRRALLIDRPMFESVAERARQSAVASWGALLLTEADGLSR